MIRLDMPQGSPEWTAARIGIPTASNFSKIITPKTMKPSSASGGYLNKLLAEWILGVSLDETVSGLMERGRELEGEAVKYYELLNDVTTETVGIILRDDRKVGCSPDRFVGQDGGLEVKCPAPHTHVGYLLNGVDDEYRCQVQGAMWLTGRQWWDLLSYHPDMPPALCRIERDEVFIAALAEAVDEFVARLEAGKQRLLELGVKPMREAA